MTVLTLAGKPIDWAHPPKLTTKVRWDTIAGDGKVVTGCLFAIAALDQLSTNAKKQFGQPVHVIQPPYNTGVPASKGTHDKDFCMDWSIAGVPWLDQQWFGRQNGWGCWWRQPWQGFSEQHVHGFPLPPDGHNFPTPVGIYVDGQDGNSSQIVDYYDHSYGLKGMHVSGEDPTPFPKDITATIFDLNHYILNQEQDTMEYKDWSDESKTMFWEDARNALWVAQTANVNVGGGKKKTVSAINALTRSAAADESV